MRARKLRRAQVRVPRFAATSATVPRAMRRRLLLAITSVHVACTPPSAPPRPKTEAAAERVQPSGAAPSEVSADDAQVFAELVKHARAITGAFGNRAPRVAEQGRTLVFVSTRDGTPHLFATEAGSARGAVRRLDPGEGRVDSFELVRPAPGVSEQPVFIGSAGGAYGVHTVALSGPSLRTLAKGTPGQFVRMAAPTLKPGSFVVQVEGETHELREGSLERAEMRVLYTDPVAFALLDVNRQGTHALCARGRGGERQDLVVVDLVGGSAKVLHTSGEIRAARWIDAGRRVMVATDGSAEANLVLGLDASSGQEIWRYVDDLHQGRVQDLVVSADEQQAASLVDTGSRHLIRFLDLAVPKSRAGKVVIGKRALRDAEMPAGEGNLAGYSAEGSRLLLDWARPDQPDSLWSVVVQSGQPEVLHADAHPSIDSLPSITAVNLEVPAADGLRVPLILYAPKGGAEKKPVIVMLHGGPSDTASIGYDAWIRFYTAFGFNVVEPNVRGSSGFGYAYEHADDGDKRKAAIADLKSVGEWVKAQGWADGSRLALFGGGYGGYLVLMAMAEQPTLWRAGVDLAGPVDLQSAHRRLRGPQQQRFTEEFGDVGVLRALSPIGHVARIERPLFVLQGEGDDSVPKAEVDPLVAGLRERGINVEYMLISGAGHDLQDRGRQADVLARTTLFLRTSMEIR